MPKKNKKTSFVSLVWKIWRKKAEILESASVDSISFPTKIKLGEKEYKLVSIDFENNKCELEPLS